MRPIGRNYFNEYYNSETQKIERATLLGILPIMDVQGAVLIDCCLVRLKAVLTLVDAAFVFKCLISCFYRKGREGDAEEADRTSGGLGRSRHGSHIVFDHAAAQKLRLTCLTYSG